MSENTTLNIVRDFLTNTLTVVGEIPKIVHVSDELRTQIEDADGLLCFLVEPETLLYRVTQAHPLLRDVWVAERVR